MKALIVLPETDWLEEDIIILIEKCRERFLLTDITLTASNVRFNNHISLKKSYNLVAADQALNDPEIVLNVFLSFKISVKLFL